MDFELTKHASYLAFVEDTWCPNYVYFEENWLHYNNSIQ